VNIKFTQPNFLFQRRSLTLGETVPLIQSIANEPNITGYSTREWMRSRDVFLLYDKEHHRIAAAILVHHLLSRWSEIAVVYVYPEYRGLNLATILLQQTIETLRFKQRKYIIYYSDSRMENLLNRCGFTTSSGDNSVLHLRTSWRVYFSTIYKPQWLCNLYRIKELHRKRRHFSKSFEFKIGFFTSPYI
jgi:GNAT superfamily N-acetyltransferase